MVPSLRFAAATVIRLSVVVPVAAYNNGVALTPPMGWVCGPLHACLRCCAATLAVMSLHD